MADNERIYLPPEWIEDLALTEEDGDVRGASLKIAQRLNEGFSKIFDRLDRLEKVGATVSGRITSFSVEGRQGLFHLTWNRIDDCDGYIIQRFTDAAGTTPDGRWDVPGSQTVQWQNPVGNVAITRYFRITPFAGGKLGSPSAIESGLSIAYTTAESAPAAPPTVPAPPSDNRDEAGRSIFTF